MGNHIAMHVIGVHVVSMQDPPDCHMGNPDMTGDSPRTGTGIVLYQIQHSLLIVWHSYSSLTFLCIHDEGSVVGQSRVQACKDTAGSGTAVQRSENKKRQSPHSA
ncbi:hypothetical protein AVEN_206413-1 [Araneus ventricosus]|uniref:Uncharacterized protein n=1 Tax=Araneus ventricosus TaxID=182803 RepID=A0A4Y2T0Z6_ARAVE|nr:hypothetical protein AVEN_206413-1 [Araneus ventricosus]